MEFVLELWCICAQEKRWQNMKCIRRGIEIEMEYSEVAVAMKPHRGALPRHSRTIFYESKDVFIFFYR